MRCETNSQKTGNGATQMERAYVIRGETSGELMKLRTGNVNTYKNVKPNQSKATPYILNTIWRLISKEKEKRNETVACERSH
jgi:hypothetical protein